MSGPDPTLVARVLAAAGDDGLVLVGGQALAFWMDRFGLEGPVIGRDVEFYAADNRSVDPLRVGDDRVCQVRLLPSVSGLEADALVANAMAVTVPDGTRLHVLHPLDLLQATNTRLLDQPDALGLLRLAIEVARAQLERDIDAVQHDERAVFDLIAAVDEYSAQAPARKNAERYDIHLADAIPAWRITSPVFWSKQWQFLRARMSPDYALWCEQQVSRGPSP